MAKSNKYCRDCECYHPAGDCNGNDRRQDHKKREKVKQAESPMFFYDQDPMLMDP